jgi:hypothetical protein
VNFIATTTQVGWALLPVPEQRQIKDGQECPSYA